MKSGTTYIFLYSVYSLNSRTSKKADPSLLSYNPKRTQTVLIKSFEYRLIEALCLTDKNTRRLQTSHYISFPRSRHISFHCEAYLLRSLTRITCAQSSPIIISCAETHYVLKFMSEYQFFIMFTSSVVAAPTSPLHS